MGNTRLLSNTVPVLQGNISLLGLEWSATQQGFGLRNKKEGRGRRRMRVSLEEKNQAFNRPFLIVVTPKVQLKKLIVPLLAKNTLLLFSG